MLDTKYVCLLWLLCSVMKISNTLFEPNVSINETKLFNFHGMGEDKYALVQFNGNEIKLLFKMLCTF